MLAAARLEQSGALEMAIDAYVKLRATADAGRVARKLGRHAEAAAFYAQSGRALEAAVCFLDTGESTKGLEQLLRVPRDHPRYREACVKAIELSQQLSALDFNLDRFVARFVREARAAATLRKRSAR